MRPRRRDYVIAAAIFGAGLILGVAAYARLGPNAASIDPGVQAALLLIVSVTLAATAGAAGAVFGSTIAADAARDSARLVGEQAEADRVEARHARFADRKVALAVDLLLAADIHRRETDELVRELWDRWHAETDEGIDSVSTEPLPLVGSTESIRAAYLALEVVAPATSAAALALYEATVPLGPLSATWQEPNSRNEYGELWTKRWGAAMDRWVDARHAFVDAVRLDLGVAVESRPGA